MLDLEYGLQVVLLSLVNIRVWSAGLLMLEYGLQVVLLSIVNVRLWSAGCSTLDS